MYNLILNQRRYQIAALILKRNALQGQKKLKSYLKKKGEIFQLHQKKVEPKNSEFNLVASHQTERNHCHQE